MNEDYDSRPDMTVDEALQYADDQTTGATFYKGKRDLQVVLCLLANEVRALREQLKGTIH